MADTVNLTLSLDKASYNAGDTMTLTLAGTASNDGSSTTKDVVIGAQVLLSDGTTVSPTQAEASVVTTTQGGPLTFAMSSVVDNSGRTWTITAGGQSATAIA